MTSSIVKLLVGVLVIVYFSLLISIFVDEGLKRKYEFNDYEKGICFVREECTIVQIYKQRTNTKITDSQSRQISSEGTFLMHCLLQLGDEYPNDFLDDVLIATSNKESELMALREDAFYIYSLHKCHYNTAIQDIQVHNDIVDVVVNVSGQICIAFLVIGIFYSLVVYLWFRFFKVQNYEDNEHDAISHGV